VRGIESDPPTPLPVDYCKLAEMECDKIVKCTVNKENNTEEKYG
jgi:hypothetical protein